MAQRQEVHGEEGMEVGTEPASLPWLWWVLLALPTGLGNGAEPMAFVSGAWHDRGRFTMGTFASWLGKRREKPHRNGK